MNANEDKEYVDSIRVSRLRTSEQFPSVASLQMHAYSHCWNKLILCDFPLDYFRLYALGDKIKEKKARLRRLRR